jgi:predicted dehydrogenase
MIQPQHNQSSRREFLKTSGRIAAASALAGIALPHVHAADNNTVQVALVGCGGRGTGAAADAFSTSKLGPVKLVAMADVFSHRLNDSYRNLNSRYSSQMDVPEDRRFIGFDGYKNAIDALKPGDVAIFATPPAFRWVHFKYAIEKGVNVFMEKPIAVDAPTSRRMIELAKEADRKNLKVGVGLMVRHCRGRQALYQKIRDGAIGQIIAMRAYRMHGPVGSAFTTSSQKRQGMSELMFQVSRFHSFLWLSGGLFSDFYIHQIDECCWMKDAWPVRCHAIGGRHYRAPDALDQNFDNYQVEYTFADGTKFFFYGRTMGGVKDDFSSFAHGANGMATISLGGHGLGRAGRIYKGHNLSREEEAWAFPGPAPNPYELEWEDLMEAIRNNLPYNEVKRSAEASLVTAMGRHAAHTGQEITYEEFYNHDHEFAPDADKLTMDSPAPLLAGADGKYPIPQPGINRKNEY